MRHILLGKAVTSVLGIGTLLMVVRGLPIPEFAAYSVMFGIMAGYLGGWVDAVIMRFVGIVITCFRKPKLPFSIVIRCLPQFVS